MRIPKDGENRKTGRERERVARAFSILIRVIATWTRVRIIRNVGSRFVSRLLRIPRHSRALITRADYA